MAFISQQNVKMAEHCVKDAVSSNRIPWAKELHLECILDPDGAFALPLWICDGDSQLSPTPVLPFLYSNSNRLSNNNEKLRVLVSCKRTHDGM